MNKECPNCGIQMKRINRNINLIHGGLIPYIRQGEFYINDDRDLEINYFVCPECGFVQQYLLDNKMKYLKDL